jgi:hypothetical protein
MKPLFSQGMVGLRMRVLTTSDTTYGNRYPITTYTSVIKGIPINGNLIPCPYYMPDDFVLIDFKLTHQDKISSKEIRLLSVDLKFIL